MKTIKYIVRSLLSLLLIVSAAFLLSEASSLSSTVTYEQPSFISDIDVNSKTVEKPVKILFIGDIFLDRYIRQVSMQNGEDYPFSCVDQLLHSADIVVGNLEGPITTNPSRSIGSEIGSPENYVFTFPTSSAATLKRHNITIVTIGNNHITNFGIGGLHETQKYLTAAGVHYFGGVKGNEPIYRMKNISFVSFNQFGGQSFEDVAAIIAGEHLKGQTVIVFAHWGDEYSQSIRTTEEIAQSFVISGANLIIGSHPHIVIPRTDIGEVPVYYSLGNFIFDQYWNEEVTTGLAVMAEISGKNIVIEEYTVSLKPDGRTCFDAHVLK